MVSSSAIADSKSLMVVIHLFVVLHLRHFADQLASWSVTRTREPGRRLGAPANDMRALLVPADRVAAREDGERAQRLEPAGQRCRPRARCDPDVAATRL